MFEALGGLFTLEIHAYKVLGIKRRDKIPVKVDKNECV